MYCTRNLSHLLSQVGDKCRARTFSNFRIALLNFHTMLLQLGIHRYIPLLASVPYGSRTERLIHILTFCSCGPNLSNRFSAWKSENSHYGGVKRSRGVRFTSFGDIQQLAARYRSSGLNAAIENSWGRTVGKIGYLVSVQICSIIGIYTFTRNLNSI